MTLNATAKTPASVSMLLLLLAISAAMPTTTMAFTTTFSNNNLLLKQIASLSLQQQQQKPQLQLFSTSSTSSADELRVKLSTNYQPGRADTEFAKRYGHLVGADIKTVGQAFAEFTQDLGVSVNPLYKSMVTDLVGTTHLTVVNARFTRDPVWSLGLVTTLDLLLKNYPEADVGKKIGASLCQSVGLDQAVVQQEAQDLLSWAKPLSQSDLEAALSQDSNSDSNNSVLALTAARIREQGDFWMYSRFFGIGLLKLMETVNVEMEKDTVYPIMEDWMSNKLQRSHLTACADSDLYFKIREKLDMMETMMKEIEIREKKRLAERLEEKAEQALRAADREEKYQAEVTAEGSTTTATKE